LVVLAAFSDGSAGSFGADEVVAGYPSGPGYYAPWSGGPYGSTSLAYTIDGVRGLDVEAR
jgi:hypothetical protein